jgi:transcriptional regulator with XRE-family HTH domain
MTITGLQVRAARAFLVWDRRDLARRAVVSLATIERMETGGSVSGKATTAALASIQATLEAEGIEFAEYNGVLGVRLHPKPAGKGKAKR